MFVLYVGVMVVRLNFNDRIENDPGHSPNKPEHVRFVRGFRKTIILKARTYVRVCSGGTLKNTI